MEVNTSEESHDHHRTLNLLHIKEGLTRNTIGNADMKI